MDLRRLIWSREMPKSSKALNNRLLITQSKAFVRSNETMTPPHTPFGVGVVALGWCLYWSNDNVWRTSSIMLRTLPIASLHPRCCMYANCGSTFRCCSHCCIRWKAKAPITDLPVGSNSAIGRSESAVFDGLFGLGRRNSVPLPQRGGSAGGVCWHQCLAQLSVRVAKTSANCFHNNDGIKSGSKALLLSNLLKFRKRAIWSKGHS